MSLMVKQRQWLGPSYHPAFAAFEAAVQACDKGGQKATRAKACNWREELDRLYSTSFLDWLQAGVQGNTGTGERAKNDARPTRASKQATKVQRGRRSEAAAQVPAHARKAYKAKRAEPASTPLTSIDKSK